MRNISFETGEYYHIFNRGTDKRKIFQDQKDFDRFLKGMEKFNNIKPIGSIHEDSFRKDSLGVPDTKLVEFIAYCLNPNHYHFLLKQVSKKGIEKFIHKLGLGYTRFFNIKNKRNGVLFQGKFKAVYVDSGDQLLYTSVYINLNNKIHKINGEKSFRSSWEEYKNSENNGFCDKTPILKEFKNIDKYKKYSLKSFNSIIQNKKRRKELEIEQSTW